MFDKVNKMEIHVAFKMHINRNTGMHYPYAFYVLFEYIKTSFLSLGEE